MTTTKSQTSTRNELPKPLYAAAGAGELAYQRLRRLPEATARTLRTAGETADTLRRRFANGDRDLTTELQQARLQFRESARRGAEVLAARAATAQERAVVGYRSLVARGERVVNERFGVATGQAEPPTRVQAVVGDPAAAVAAAPEAPAPGARTEPGERARGAKGTTKAPGERPAA